MKTDSTMYVGLDYHQSSIQLCVMDAAGKTLLNRKCDNDLLALTRHLPKGVKVQATIEAMPGSADLAEALCRQPGWSVHLAHAQHVARMKRTREKTDRSDAYVLADLTRVGYVQKVWLPPQSVRELRRLVSHRLQLVDRAKALKLRVGSLLRDHRVKLAGTRWSKPWLLALAQTVASLPADSAWIISEQLDELAHLSMRIKAADARLKEVTAQDTLTGHLLAQAGVGLITATALRAAIGRFDRFKNGKSLARYCGLSPRNASSGSRQNQGGLVDDANKRLRSLLIKLAWRLMRASGGSGGRWKAMACRLRDRGKASCLIAAAVANRWVRQLHHQLVEVIDDANVTRQVPATM